MQCFPARGDYAQSDRHCTLTLSAPAAPARTQSANDDVDDATWVLTSSFVILTMQSGFGLLEMGMLTKKDEVNVMIKNISVRQ